MEIALYQSTTSIKQSWNQTDEKFRNIFRDAGRFFASTISIRQPAIFDGRRKNYIANGAHEYLFCRDDDDAVRYTRENAVVDSLIVRFISVSRVRFDPTIGVIISNSLLAILVGHIVRVYSVPGIR